MSARDKLLLKVLVPIAVLAALWALVLSPRLDDMKSARTDVTSAQAAVSEAQAALVERQVTARQLRAQRRTLAAAGRAVPTSVAIPQLLRQIERLAGRTKVDVDTVSQAGNAGANTSNVASTVITPAGVNATNIALTFIARYGRARAFMTGLDRLVRVSGQKIRSTGRLITVSSITVAPSGSRLRADIKTTIYTLKTDAQMSADAAAAAAASGVAPADGAQASSGSASASAPTAAIGAP